MNTSSHAKPDAPPIFRDLYYGEVTKGIKQESEARSFLLAEFVALGMVCDFAIHEQVSATDGLVQPHVHALLTLRTITPQGFGRKIRAWGSRALFNTWREH